jgi:hypothetical protein
MSPLSRPESRLPYWADPDKERERRMLAFTAGLVLGGVFGVVVASLFL